MGSWNIVNGDEVNCAILKTRKDYTWRCDCNMEGTCGTLCEARGEAKRHLRNHPPHEATEVFIDEYDLDEGELTGRYEKLNNLRK